VIVTGAGLKGPSVLCRVRGLLADLRDSTQLPGDPAACARLVEARQSGLAQRDLGEIRGRLERLNSLHPELAVETGPLLRLTGEHIDRVERRVAAARPAGAFLRGAAR